MCVCVLCIVCVYIKCTVCMWMTTLLVLSVGGIGLMCMLGWVANGLFISACGCINEAFMHDCLKSHRSFAALFNHQVFDLLMEGSELVEKLQWNTTYFRSKMSEAGFVLKVYMYVIYSIFVPVI